MHNRHEPPPMPEVLRHGPSNPSPRGSRRAGSNPGMMNQLMRVASIGTNVAFTVVGGALLGFGFDWLVGTKPWGLLVGAGLGVTAGLMSFIRESRKLYSTPPGQARSEGSGSDTPKDG